MAERRSGGVAVAMSGGVDSSVAAALLRERGDHVVGVTLRLHGDGVESGCGSDEDLRDAATVAARLGIEHHVLDVRDRFDETVIRPYVDAYARGVTPNPCVLCNRRLKLGALVDWAVGRGLERVATGHYARVEPAPGGGFALWRGLDPAKDQSYFLYRVSPDVLARLELPLGGLEKPQVRALAERYGLAVAGKRDSQEACFVPDGDVGAFVRQRSPETARGPGPIVDMAGRVLGQHRGLESYTVGQRRGLGVAARERLFVVALDVPSNRLVVGPREATYSTTAEVDEVRWLAGSPATGVELRVTGQVRYRHPGTPGGAVVAADGGSLSVTFDEPVHAVTPGQSLVLYDGDRVLGGGWIRER